MTKQEFLALIQRVESPKLDFKRDYEEKKENTEYIADIISIANGNIDNIGETGYLIFGIKEITALANEIYGVGTQKNLQEIQRHIAEKLNNHVSPHVMNIEAEDFYFDLKRVIVIKIPFQDSILILKKDIKQTRYKVFNFLYRIGDAIQVIPNANDSKKVEYFKQKMVNYKKANQIKPSNKIFKPKREIDEEYGTYLNEKNKVSLFASLPVLNDYESRLSIKCEITFILENSTKIMVTISEEEVLTSLFSGYRFKHYKSDNKRDWIVFLDETSNLYTIQISSTSLNISSKTVEILSQILDDLQEVYASKMNRIEAKLNSKGFPFSKEYKNGFELCQIHQRLWTDIQKFVLKHDRHIEGNDNEWDIFEDSVQDIMVCEDMRVNMMLTYEIELSEDRQKITTSFIKIIWNTLDMHHPIDNDNIRSVKEAHDWFCDEFIPQVKKERYEDEEINNSFKSLFEKLLNKKINYKDLDTKYEFQSEDDESLLEVINNLVNFFYAKEVAISKNTLKDLYEGLISLFEKSEKLDYSYLHNKLLLVGNKQRILSKESQLNSASKKDFIEYIQKELKEIEKGEMSIDDLVSRYTIDHILRCYNIIIRDNIDSYRDSFKHNILDKLKDIKKIYDIKKISRRRLECIA